MEKHLERVMEEITNTTGVYGCVFADHQGLCLGVPMDGKILNADSFSNTNLLFWEANPLTHAPNISKNSKGRASTDSAGIIGAIAEQAAKLEPQKSSPVITLENDNHMCIIQRNGTITGAIYKNV